jgi:hypothetical protein
VGFALTAALGLVSVFALDGAAAGVTSFFTMLAFIGACIYALRGQDPDTVGRNRRAGLGGWIGGWF